MELVFSLPRRGEGSRERSLGFSTVEILIAFMIVVLVTTAVIGVVFGSQSLAVDSQTNQEAQTLAQKLLENARALSRSNFPSLNTSATTTALGNLTYNATTTVTDISPCSKKVDARVDWDLIPRNLWVSLSTIFTSTTTANNLGSDCDPFPPGDEWDNPGTLGSADFSPPGIKATAVVEVSVNGTPYAMVTSIHSASSTADFWAVDVTDPANPVVAGGSGLNTAKTGLNDLVVVGDYAYVVQDEIVDQLQVIDVSAPSTSLSLVNEISLEPYGVDPTGSDPEGRVIAYYDDRIFIGLATTVGPEFLVFTIASPGTPTSPAFVGAINSSFNHSVNDIAVSGNYAYLATGYDNGEVIVVDVSGATPVDTNERFNAPGGEDGRSLYLLGNKLYFGRNRATSSLRRDFYILNISTSDPTDLTELGSIRNEDACADQPNCGLNPNTAIVGIMVQGKYAFLATSAQTAGFQVWDISIPANIVQPSTCSSFNYSEKATGIDYANNLIFVSNESNDALQVIYDQPSTCS